jgi:hypothetical protein
MKIVMIFFLFYSSLVLAQEHKIATTELKELVMRDKNGKASIDAEKPASFPLGAMAIRDMISNNFRVWKVSTTTEKESCEIFFIIDENGSMTEIRASGSNESFNREAVRALSKIKQKWIPAELNGEKVRYKFRIPLTISFKDNRTSHQSSF